MVTIYHNPRCSNSRGALDLIRASGTEPEIIEYLSAPPSADELRQLLEQMKMPARALLRNKEAVYAELGLDDPKWSDEDLIAFMLAHPILINRPIVVTSKGVRLCRPPEVVQEIL